MSICDDNCVCVCICMCVCVSRTTQGKGVMPDGTSRFTCKGRTIYHFMGTSTFSEYTVLPEISLAKVSSVLERATLYYSVSHVSKVKVQIYERLVIINLLD